MPLSSINAVRSLIGDNDKSAINEDVSRGDGVSTQFQLDMFPVRTGSFSVFVTGVAKPSATCIIALGVIDLTGSAPPGGDVIVATYQYNALSDQEIQACIDIASAGGNLLAASYACRGLAGNYARFFSYTQGNKSVNKDNLSKKLLDLAESYEDAYENNIKLAGLTVTVMRFDDSGTAFDGFDTGSANNYVSTGTWR